MRTHLLAGSTWRCRNYTNRLQGYSADSEAAIPHGRAAWIVHTARAGVIELLNNDLRRTTYVNHTYSLAVHSGAAIIRICCKAMGQTRLQRYRMAAQRGLRTQLAQVDRTASAVV